METRNSFEQATAILPHTMRTLLLGLPENIRDTAQEIRLRCGKPVMLVTADGTYFLTEDGQSRMAPNGKLHIVDKAQMEGVFNKLCAYSVYSQKESLSNGYITMTGGHRVGIGATAVADGGSVGGIRDVSSLNIRIARQIQGAADKVLYETCRDGVPGMLIAGPPSSGKTTILRDLARNLGGGYGGQYRKIALIDERCELAAVKSGVPQNDIGINSDVLSAYPKGEGILTALRVLSPEIIICDEVGAMEEIHAVEMGLNSGVTFILSIHAGNCRELTERPQILKLLETGAFQKLVMLTASGAPGQIERIYEAEELKHEIHRNRRSGNREHWNWEYARREA